jgi:hypothetical protein
LITRHLLLIRIRRSLSLERFATQFDTGIPREEHPNQSGVTGYRAQSPAEQLATPRISQWSFTFMGHWPRALLLTELDPPIPMLSAIHTGVSILVAIMYGIVITKRL